MISETTQPPAEIPTSTGLTGGDVTHTPGPWKAAIYNGHNPGIDSADTDPRAVIYGSNVGGSPHAGILGDNERQQIANAHLIAASPDLLKACRVAHLMLCERFLDGPAARDVAGTLERAIGKALGTEPVNNPILPQTGR